MLWKKIRSHFQRNVCDIKYESKFISKLVLVHLIPGFLAVIDRSKDSHGIEISQKQRYVYKYGCILLQKLMQKLATDLNAKSRRSVQQITAYELLTPERRIGPSKLPHSCSAFPGLSRSFAAPDPAPRQTWGTTRWYGS